MAVQCRIVGAPVFSAREALLSAPGYHPADAVYYQPEGDLVIPPVPETPADDDVASARSLLLDEFLCDFPFVGDAELAHALAFFLQPYLRDLIEGATPLYLFEKPSAGTGASILVEVLSLPALGHLPDVMTVGRDRDEWRKRITAKLSSGASIVIFDNVDRLLDSSDLAPQLRRPFGEIVYSGPPTCSRSLCGVPGRPPRITRGSRTKWHGAPSAVASTRK
jgi:hypothetical protein